MGGPARHHNRIFDADLGNRFRLAPRAQGEGSRVPARLQATQCRWNAIGVRGNERRSDLGRDARRPSRVSGTGGGIQSDRTDRRYLSDLSSVLLFGETELGGEESSAGRAVFESDSARQKMVRGRS